MEVGCILLLNGVLMRLFIDSRLVSGLSFEVSKTKVIIPALMLVIIPALMLVIIQFFSFCNYQISKFSY